MAIVGRQTDQINIRVPLGLRERVQKTAESNNRSMNSEIVAALEEKYPRPPMPESINERLREAAEDVASAWAVVLQSLGQAPEDNQQLARLKQAIESA